MALVDVLSISTFLSAATTDTTPTLITRDAILSIERRVIAKIFVQDECVMRVWHLSFLMHPRDTRRLMVLAVLI